MRSKISVILALGVLAFTASADAQVRINEIMPNQGTSFDGGEYIELYNAGGSAVSLAGWVLTGTEYNGTCGGERYWQFPVGASIPAGGYLVITRDNKDTVPTETDDGFLKLFGFNADFEMYDAGRSYETDDPSVPNLVLTNGTSNDDQIRLIPGQSDYAKSCSGSSSRRDYEALYLYNGPPPPGAGALIDVIEYDDPAYCSSDACLGVGTGDNDAYDGLPAVGESLGRNAIGADTNNSSNDLRLGTPTPKAANIPNPGPTLSNFTVNNPDPFAGESVPISIDAVDANGVGPVYLVFTVNGGAPDSLLMTNPGGGSSTYSTTLPGRPDNTHIEYFVRARDLGSPVGTSKYPFFDKRRVRWGTQTIFQCQFHSPASDTGRSAEAGRAVNVYGVVVTESGPLNPTGTAAFTIQSGTGPWNGVYVFDPTGTVSVARGDSVRVSGEVQEYGGRTEIVVFGAAYVQILASGRPVPVPYTVTCSQLTTGSQIGEALEGVLARLYNVEVTNLFTFGEWGITDATGTCRVDDQAFYLYTPQIGDSLDVVQGIVDYTFGDRKLEPRDDLDIQGPPVVSTVRYSPIPPTFAAGAITISASITDNGTITRAKLYYSTNNGASYDSTNMVLQSGTTWAATVGPYADGTDLDYNIQVTDNDGFNGRAPSAGNYDLFVGFRTIQTVQSTVIAGSDSSSYEGQPVNVAGIVTQAPGMVADNLFVIQNHWTTDPAYRGIHVYSGGSLAGQLVLGDSVAVCGDVDEYYGLTEIRMHFTDAYRKYGNQTELPGFALSTTAYGPDSTGALPPAEQWEGVLLQFNGSTVTNAAAGFGQYYIDNTAPTTGQETLVDDEARLGGGLTYLPTLGDMRTYRGIGDFTYGQYKLQPRNNQDILPFNPADAVDAPLVAGAALAFALHQNSPNPAGEVGTRISFALPRAERAVLRVFDVQGRLVRTLLNGQVEAGPHTVDWNGRNDDGQEVSSGVYFYRLVAGEDEATRKMIFLR